MNNTYERVVEIIKNYLDTDEIVSPESIISALSLDSLSFIEALVQIEDEFGIEFPDDMLTRNKYDTLADIAATAGELIANKRGE